MTNPKTLGSPPVRDKRPVRLVGGVLAGLLLLSIVPATPAASAASASLPPLGMSMDAVVPLKADGAAPAFGSYWVGPWMATSGWGGLDNALKIAVANDVTPVIYWYYWGDSISPSCIDNGCSGRSQAQWTSMTNTLADKIRTHMGGRETIVVLENEFNKGGITGTYAPTFDAKLETVAKTLKGVGGVKLVLGFGAWSESEWTKFPRSAAQSDYIGFQMMRASTRDSEASYRGSADRVAYLSGYIAQKFNKPSFLYDVALSSYPDAYWAKLQAETLQAIFDELAPAGQNGLRGVVYRSLKDTYMDPANYFGLAESHWGLKTKDNVAKPAYAVWKTMATGGSPTPPPPPTPTEPNAPGAFEAESMTATAGGRHTDSRASGGAAWNLWANGELRKVVVPKAAGDYQVRVTAMGQAAGGVDPRMELRLDGKSLGGFSVPAGAYRDFTVPLSLGASGGTLSVAYTNDAIVGGVDRNLIVDVVRVESRAAPPPAENQPPTAAFTSAANVLSVAFDASGSKDPEGATLTYAWSFGDGASGTGVSPTHGYAKPGTYDVVLTVRDGALSASARQQVTLAYPAPVASFTTSGGGSAWKFDASASKDPAGGTLTYAWDLGDGTKATGATASRTYASPGDYTVKLTVTNRFGESATQSALVRVAGYEATFDPAGRGNAWWVQTAVKSNERTVAVCASVDGGSCRALTLQSWGEWAASFHVAEGSKVTFTATSESGAKATSGAYVWPSGAPATSATATFQPYGNNWWVQTMVKSASPITAVCASVDGGSCRALTLQSWGGWAASFHVATGAKVRFVATTAAGEKVTSDPYTWPVK